jgi:hypothetical protein
MTPERKAMAPQRLIGAVFLVLGLWCLVAPVSVEALGLRPEYRHQSLTTAILIGCFGAQAVLNAIFIFFSRFTRKTFFAYGVALTPFFFFNYYFVYVLPAFNEWMAMDFIANLFMLGLCVWGWRLTPPVNRQRRALSARGASS